MTIQPPSPPYAGPPAHSSGNGNKPITRVVIHCTAGAGDDPTRDGIPHQTAAYFRSPSSGGSAHYVVGRDEVLQTAWDSLVCWHAPPNPHSIGVELTCSLANEGKDHWADANHQAMLNRAAPLVAQLCLAYGVPIVKLTVADLKAGRHGICGHGDVSQAWHESTHWDPGPYFPWVDFIGKVKAAAAKLQEKPTPDPEPPAVADFTMAHCSGLWDAPDPVWSRAIAAMRDADATVITLTETGRKGLVKSVTPKGWASAHLDEKPGQDECSILWATRAWESAGEAWATQVAQTQFYTGTGVLRPPVQTLAKPLRHKKTGQVVLFSVTHDPSDIEGKDGFSGTPPRIQAHQEATEGRHEVFAKGLELYPDAARIDAGDRNVNYNLAWVREWWAAEYPLLTPCWEGNIPERGTLGKRVIDWAAASPQLVRVEARVLGSVAGFDHNPLVAKYAVEA